MCVQSLSFVNCGYFEHKMAIEFAQTKANLNFAFLAKIAAKIYDHDICVCWCWDKS